MVDTNPTIATVTLNANGVHAQLKIGGCKKGPKKKNQLQVVWKKLTLNIKRHIRLKVNGQRKTYKQK